MLTRCPELPGRGKTQRFLRGSTLIYVVFPLPGVSTGGYSPHSVSLLLSPYYNRGHHLKRRQADQ
jgi:hypothetical protein